MNIAINNLHKLPNLTNFKIHNYVLELIKSGKVKYLFFSDWNKSNEYGISTLDVLGRLFDQYTFRDLGFDRVEIIFSPKTLNSQCDVLLDFNSTLDSEFCPAIRNFQGLKIYHLMDYFWLEPGSKKYQKLIDNGVDYLFSYSRTDKHCKYFQEYFPKYIGKVIPIPFGYSGRFVSTTPFIQRKEKCVAVGSVNPLRPSDSPENYYKETADFYRKEKWLHKFRRMLVVNRHKLMNMDSMLPVFPKYKDFNYDIVKIFNQYKMFVSDETLFYFPTAKTYEGTACGSVMVCSDHPCFTDFGFIDGINCIKHKQYSVDDFNDKINYYLKHQSELNTIQKNSYNMITSKYSHKKIAFKTYKIIKEVYSKQKNSYLDENFWM